MPESTPQSSTYSSSKIVFIAFLQLLVVMFSVFCGYIIGKNQPNISEEKLIAQNVIPTPTITPLPTDTPAATYTPTPTTKPVYKPAKIALHIDSIDYSNGHPAGLITSNIKVQIYKMDGTFIEEKTPSPYVQKGEIGTGGDTVFYVLPSTYKVISDTGATGGTCIVTVRSTTEYNSCAIYLVKK